MSCLFCTDEDDDDSVPSLDAVIASGMRAGRLQLASRALPALPLALLHAHAARVPLTEIWLQDNQLTALDLCSPAFDALAAHAQLIYLLNNRIGGTLSGAHLARWTQLQEVNLSGNASLANLPAEVSAGWRHLRQLYLNDLPLLTELPDMSQVPRRSHALAIAFCLPQVSFVLCVPLLVAVARAARAALQSHCTASTARFNWRVRQPRLSFVQPHAARRAAPFDGRAPERSPRPKRSAAACD